MNVLDVINQPWAILPAKLVEIQRVYLERSAGTERDLSAFEASRSGMQGGERLPYQIRDGVAVIPLEGIIAKRMNMLTQFSGGTSSELAGRDLEAALGNSAVHSIILAIDSPGGTVDGTQALSDQVLAARKIKPVVALASGIMASAAYWIGSAAQAVYVADGTTITGSIGVVSSHVDVSQAEARQGLKTTEIYAGKFKRIASTYGPLTDAGKQAIQDQVDYTYSLFVGDVARNRGVSIDAVLRDMADGRVFMGKQGLNAGLADGITTLRDLVASLARASRA